MKTRPIESGKYRGLTFEVWAGYLDPDILCGYVRLPSAHPWVKDRPLDVSVDGGITWPGPDHPRDSRKGGVWIGFDCRESLEYVAKECRHLIDQVLAAIPSPPKNTPPGVSLYRDGKLFYIDESDYASLDDVRELRDWLNQYIKWQEYEEQAGEDE